MLRHRLLPFALLATLVFPIDAAAATWTELQSDHFTLLGDASEHDIRQIAQKLEQFRDVLHRVLAGSPADSPVPTVVFVFSNQTAMGPFRPAYDGKPVDVAGFFVDADESNYIVLSADQEEAGLGVVFHELTHAMTENTVGQLPTWLNEGLAAFYETAQPGAGTSMTVGRYPDGYIALARPMTMSIDELLKVTGGSRVYNESSGNRRNVFYAESWALTHYLMLGNVARREQFADYLSRLEQGVPSADAFHAAFQTDTQSLEKELRDYVSRTNFPVLRLSTNPDAGKAASARGVRLTEREARASLGDLLAHIAGRGDDARAYLQKLLQEDDHLARALASMGTLEIRQQHAADGLSLLERAATAAPDDGRIQGEFGAALVAKLSAAPGADDADATLAEARRVLTRAVTLQPGAANSLSNAAYVMMVRDEDLASARDLLARAIKAAPARDQYRLLFAEVLVRQREYDQATGILGPLVARGSSPVIRDRARRLLAQVADIRNRQASTPAASPTGSAGSAASTTTSGAKDALALPPPPPPNPAVARSNVAPPTGEPAFRPILRKVGAGELRALGRFQSVECSNGALILVVDTPDGTLRLAASTFADVEFISYRPGPPGAVNCGAQPSAPRVLVTYHPAPDTTGPSGTAIAIELLPDGYTPDL